MKIATFNCNSIRSRMPLVLDWLKAEAPDALALQETKVADESFPREAIEEAGYHVAFRGQKSYNGVALITREPPKDVRFGLDDGEEPDEPRLVEAKVGGVVVVNTYVPQGRDALSVKFQYKLRWLERLLDYFDSRFTRRKRLVWVGDFNIAPEPMDVYDSERLMGHVCHHPDVFAAWRKFLDWGFVDVFRKHRPGAGEYSFFDYRVPKALERGMGWRVDHILATPVVANKSTAAWIDLDTRKRDKPSDHAVVVAEFEG